MVAPRSLGFGGHGCLWIRGLPEWGEGGGTSGDRAKVPMVADVVLDDLVYGEAAPSLWGFGGWDVACKVLQAIRAYRLSASSRSGGAQALTSPSGGRANAPMVADGQMQCWMV